MTINYKAQSGQSIYDICLMTYGTMDKIITLVKDSMLSNITDENIAGKIFPFESSLIADVGFSNSIKKQGKIFATAKSSSIEGNVQALANDDGVILTTDDGIFLTID